MSGITNRPKELEDENQERVEQKKQTLPADEQRGKHDHPVGKDAADEPEERGRVTQTGVGRGVGHAGH